MELVEFLPLVNSFSDSIIAFATIALAILTCLLWRETKKTREFNQAAEIAISFENHPYHANAINLVIENTGKGMARNLKLGLVEGASVELKSGEFVKLQELSIFKETIPVFKSGQKIIHFAFLYPDVKDPSKVSFDISSEWNDYSEKLQKQNSRVAIYYYSGIKKLGHDPLYEIADVQKKLYKQIREVLGHRHIRVETITSKELAAERKKWIEELEADISSENDNHDKE